MSDEQHASDTHPFHLALRVHDLGAAEAFYAGILGAGIGRRDSRWIDFDLFGHQVTVHLDESMGHLDESMDAVDGVTNPVDGDDVPVPHFGVIFDIEGWRALSERVMASDAEIVIAPRIRFEGLPGEQGTFFLRDPSGNALEFKGFRDLGMLFAR